MEKDPSTQGFTLIEISIVMAILGGLIGAIVLGQSLIKASEVRKTANAIGQYRAAVDNFRTQYNALPGDMPSATSFWGALDGSTGNTNACSTTASNGALTCNGDGDGGLASVSWGNERALIWKHMANAGVIEGNFTGYGDGTLPNKDYMIPGSNMPKGPRESAYYLYTSGTYGTDFPYPPGVTALRVGASIDTGSPRGGFLLPREALNIDTKIDDGKPATGKILAPISTFASAPNCTTTDVVSTAAYNLTTTNLCFLDYYWESL